jgi:hypothetical protein
VVILVEDAAESILSSNVEMFECVGRPDQRSVMRHHHTASKKSAQDGSHVNERGLVDEQAQGVLHEPGTEVAVLEEFAPLRRDGKLPLLASTLATAASAWSACLM